MKGSGVEFCHGLVTERRGVAEESALRWVRDGIELVKFDCVPEAVTWDPY